MTRMIKSIALIGATLANSAALFSVQQVSAHSDHDITNKVLTSTNPDCGSYIGEYTSDIEDVSRGMNFSGSLEITASNSTCTFQTNQIPNHDAGENSNFATPIAENNAALDITRSPEMASTKSLPGMGAAAILLNGVKWEAYPAACFDVGNEPLGRENVGCFHEDIDHPWRYNIGAVTMNKFGFDTHRAHVQPGGLYHYHSTPDVLFDIDCEGKAESPVIGFAADGYPVYGSCFKDSSGNIRKAKSSYQVKSGIRQQVGNYTTPYKTGNVLSDNYDGQFIGDFEYIEGKGDLDECNGMTLNGQYGYYVTDAYPYVLACFSGTPMRGFR